MTSYKELGLVNTKEMFAKAIKGGYAIPAFNFNNMEQLQAIIKAAAEEKSPVILQVSKGARNYANPLLLRYMAQGAVEYAKSLGWEHPQIVLHLDHGDSFELCKDCIEHGFSSVMIDGSHLPYEENVALTKKVCDYAHQYDVTVEGELGVLAGVEDEVSSDHHTYTDPEEVIDFATRIQELTHSQSQSAHHTVLTSSSPNSAPAMPTVVSYLPHWHSTYSMPLWKNSPVSPSYSTDQAPFLRNTLKKSTNTAASSPTQSVSPKKNSARQPRAQSARLISTLTAVSQ